MTPKDVSWQLGATKKTLSFAKWAAKNGNTDCKDKITYKLTVPTAISKVAKAASDGLSLVLDGTSTDSKAAATHTITLQAVGPSG